MGVLDLDAARAARAEAAGERHQLVFQGATFELPVEIPADFAFFLVENKMREALGALLEERFDEFWKLRPSVGDLTELANGVARLYGFGNEGESEASAAPSTNGGKPSRPTSSASTRRTSAAPVTALPKSG